MSLRCGAGFCSNTRKDGVSLFRFPKDPELRSKWLKMVRRTRGYWEPSPRSVLCSAHFELDCFDAAPALKESLGCPVQHKRVLLPTAVPTVFLRGSSTATERKQEMTGQRTVLDLSRKTTVLPDEGDFQQVLLSEVVVSCKEEPEPPNIKEEEDEVTKFPLNIVKSEDDEANFSQLHQKPLTSRLTPYMKTETDGDKLDLLLHSDHQKVLSSEDDTDDSEDWSQTGLPQSGLDSVETQKVIEDFDYKSLSCLACKKIFNSRSALTLHIKSCGGGSLPCIFCGRFFTEGQRLKTHMRFHKAPFCCFQCGKCFNCKRDVKKHTRIHTGEKPFICSKCGRCFNQSHHLKRHMLTHAGEQFCCSKCEECYNRKGDLNAHMMTHAGEKPFCCTECGKCFHQQHHLNSHLRTHTGERPFCCTECGKCFNQRHHLKKHMLIHSAN